MPNLSNVRISSPSQEHSVSPAPDQDSTLQLALKTVQAAEDRKGGDITLLKVAEVSLLADYFVIVTGFSKVQVRAIANSIISTIAESTNRKPIHREGISESTWVVLDYGDVIVHILMPHEREYYDLEAFWGHAERINFQPLLEQSAAKELKLNNL